MKHVYNFEFLHLLQDTLSCLIVFYCFVLFCFFSFEGGGGGRGVM